MAALSTSASSCGSALAAAPSRSAVSRSSSSSRTLLLGKSPKIVSNSGSCRFAPLSVRATTSTEEATTTTTTSTTAIPSASTSETTFQSDEILADLKAKWDGIENKTNVFIYGGGALVALWLSATIVGAVNSVPLLPKVLELVGLGYTGWFVYRYLLFKESRKELASDVEELKAKITGAGKE